jgi:two-component system response regulator HydG
VATREIRDGERWNLVPRRDWRYATLRADETAPVIQERKVTRIGATVERDIDIRIIAATLKDLKQEVKAGRFRQDLYYRLNVLNLRIPPLRERLEDIPVLARNLSLQDCGKNEGRWKGFDAGLLEN